MRDGDIVDLDGTSALQFNQAVTGNYFVAVRHRNHIGVMSETALPLSATTTTVDFRLASTPTYKLSTSGIDVAQVVVVVFPSYKLKGYYSGDINMNGETIFQGTGNDVEFIYQNVTKNHTGNVLKQSFFIIKEQIP